MNRVHGASCPLIISESLSVGTLSSNKNIILNMIGLPEMAFYIYISLDVHEM